MNEHPQFDPATCADPSQWPRCPRCGSRELLVAAAGFHCLSCPETGAAAVLRGDVTRHALARMVLVSHNVVAPIQFGPFPQGDDPELGHVLHARQVEAFLAELARREPIEVGRGLSLRSLHEPPRPIGTTELIADPGRAQQPDALIFHMHLGCLQVETFGAPPMAFDPTRDFARVATGSPLITQPIHWPLLRHHDSPHAAVRYVAGLEARGADNVTLSVLEDMDSSAVHARLAMFSPDEPAGTIREFQYDDAELAVAAMRKKFERMRKAVEPEALVFSFEREFGLERNAAGILGELETLEIWDVYRKERT